MASHEISLYCKETNKENKNKLVYAYMIKQNECQRMIKEFLCPINKILNHDTGNAKDNSDESRTIDRKNLWKNHWCFKFLGF